MQDMQCKDETQLESLPDSDKGADVQRVWVEASKDDRKRINLIRVQFDFTSNRDVVSRAIDALSRELGLDNLALPPAQVNPSPLTANVGN